MPGDIASETPGTAPSPAPRDPISGWMQEIAPFGIITTDPELRVTGWNQWMSTHSGIQPDQILGQPLLAVFPDVATRRLDQYYRDALAGVVRVLSTALHGYLFPFPSTLRENGSRNMLQTARIAPLLAGQSVLGTITIVEDVTQRETQAATLRRQHTREKLLSWTLVQLLRSPDPVQEIDRLLEKVGAELGIEGAFTAYDPSPVHAVATKEPGGDHDAGARQPRASEAMIAWTRLQEGPATLEHLQQHTDAATSELRAAGFEACAGFPIRIGDRALGTLCFGTTKRQTFATGEVEFLLVLSQYITIALDRSQREAQLRDAQQALLVHAAELETKVEERTAKLHETISQLESFSYTVAHDLRAPIRSLKGYCEVLRDDHGKRLNSEGHAIIERLSRSAHRLDDLTRDLLTFSRLSLKTVSLEPVDLDALLTDASSINPALSPAVLTVKLPLGGVHGQRTLVQQCLSNLLDNAVKFAAPERALRITVRSELVRHVPGSTICVSSAPFHPATRPDAAPIEYTSAPIERWCRRVWVEDNGVGIPAEAHQKIFGIFERATDSSTDGTGIGLAIVARAMQQMDGSCGVASEPGLGSRFWLQFYPFPEELTPPKS